MSITNPIIAHGLGGETPAGGFMPSRQPQKTYKTITIKVTYKGTQTWKRSYTVAEGKANVLIRVKNFINTITNNITIRVSNFRKRASLLKVLRWKKG